MCHYYERRLRYRRYRKGNKIMTVLKITSCMMICLAVLGCQPAGPGQNAPTATLRIGVYDSRAIAVAIVGGEYYVRHIQPLEDAFRKAKTEGNAELIKELEPKVWARRKESHRQAFGTAPVDNILDYIKDQIPGIAAEAGVGPIVSKWDTDTLSKYKAAQQVDVTMRLVEAFKPNPRQLKHAVEIQKHKPVSAKVLEKHMARQGH
jgi:hypothetical protein